MENIELEELIEIMLMVMLNPQAYEKLIVIYGKRLKIFLYLNHGKLSYSPYISYVKAV